MTTGFLRGFAIKRKPLLKPQRRLPPVLLMATGCNPFLEHHKPNHITSAAAPKTVEDVFGGVDLERRCLVVCMKDAVYGQFVTCALDLLMKQTVVFEQLLHRYPCFNLIK